MISVAVAGSTIRTKGCAECLLLDDRFVVTHVITPAPKPVGRKQVVTPNPLHQWALDHHIPVTLIETKINQDIRTKLETSERPNLLLVVDFGFLVPQWLLDWPTIAPVNIHPSALPKYRGSSPGQFVLISGETTSAVTVMVMDAKLDHGPIITQLPFDVGSSWTSTEYYQAAFALVTAKLPDILTTFVREPTMVTPQPDESPTPIAHMLKREDGFVEKARLVKPTEELFNKWRGLTPWPGIWTVVSTPEGEKRLKILQMAQETDGSIEIQEVQFEGKNPQAYTKQLGILFM